MAIYALDKRISFPPVTHAQPDGLLAMGGDLSIARLILAYQSGIFPWFEGDTPLWWSPDPRFVLLPQELRISHSMKQLLKKNVFRYSNNEAFEQVIENCRSLPRRGQYGTWITSEMKQAYLELHKLGLAKSAEVWQEHQLVGGLYGVQIGKVFFGESMFSLVSNASKYAFISFIRQEAAKGLALVDCQVYTPHLETLGARMIPRAEFIKALDKLLNSAGK